MEIIVVSSVQRFRRLAKELPKHQESVLEIGCSTGLSTQILAKHCAQVVAVDISQEMVDKACSATAEFSNVTLIRMDGRDAEQLKQSLSAPDFIFLDIGGTALLGNVVSLLRGCIRTFATRVIVVRSFELAELWTLIAEAEKPDGLHLRPVGQPNTDCRALNSLLDLSRSYNTSDRIFAVRKLSKVKVQSVMERLKQMIEDPHPKVHRIARNAIGKVQR